MDGGPKSSGWMVREGTKREGGREKRKGQKKRMRPLFISEVGGGAFKCKIAFLAALIENRQLEKFESSDTLFSFALCFARN